MKKNIGSIDQLLRIIIAIIILALYLRGIISGTTSIVLLIIAALLVITSLVNFCPVYRIFGLSTFKTVKK